MEEFEFGTFGIVHCGDFSGESSYIDVVSADHHLGFISIFAGGSIELEVNDMVFGFPGEIVAQIGHGRIFGKGVAPAAVTGSGTVEIVPKLNVCFGGLVGHAIHGVADVHGAVPAAIH